MSPVETTLNVTLAPAVMVCESGWVYPQIADWAVARKLAVSIWHLLMGHCIEMQEPVQHLATKLLKIATLLGKEAIKQAGFARRADFVRHVLESINTSHNTAFST